MPVKYFRDNNLVSCTCDSNCMGIAPQQGWFVCNWNELFTCKRILELGNKPLAGANETLQSVHIQEAFLKEIVFSI